MKTLFIFYRVSEAQNRSIFVPRASGLLFLETLWPRQLYFGSATEAQNRFPLFLETLLITL